MNLVLQILTQMQMQPNGGFSPAKQPLIPRDELIIDPTDIALKVPYWPAVSADGTCISYIAPSSGMENSVSIWVKKTSDILSGVKTDPIQVTKEPSFYIPAQGWTYVPHLLWYINGSAMYTVDVTAPYSPVVKLFASMPAGDPRAPTIVKMRPDKRHTALIGIPKGKPLGEFANMMDYYEMDWRTGDRKLVFSPPKDAKGLLYFDQTYKARMFFTGVESENGTMTVLYRRNDGTNENPVWTTIITVNDTTLAKQQFPAAIPPTELITFDPNDLDTVLWRDMYTNGKPVYSWKNINEPYESAGKVIYRNQRAEGNEWLHHNGALVGIRENASIPKVTIMDAAYADDWRRVESILPNTMFAVESQAIDMSKWIVRAEPSNKAPRYYLYDSDTKQAAFLFSIIPRLEKYELPVREPVFITSRDGFVQSCYLTKPYDAKQGEKRPLILSHHGQPDVWVWQWYSDWPFLADRGYYVLACNVRSSMKNGNDYFRAGFGEGFGGRMYEDVVDSGRWAVQRGLTDPDTICGYGASFGGVQMMYVLTEEPDFLQCAINLFGVVDMYTNIMEAPQYKGLNPNGIQWKWFQWMYMNNTWWTTPEGDKWLKEHSAVNKIDRIKTPLYRLHGELDTHAIFSDATDYLAKMKALGNGTAKDFTLIALPKGGHGGFDPPSWRVFWAYAERFFAQYLGGRYEPVGYIAGADYEVRYDTNGIAQTAHPHGK